jgi:acetyltransferase-like isoleucine patch superfamily enzyme
MFVTKFKLILRRFIFDLSILFIPELRILRTKDISFSFIESFLTNCLKEEFVEIQPPYKIENVKIGKGTYISQNSIISETEIGKFCSIGPNFLCGWGIHPINGLSTSPMFYSTAKQNGRTFSRINKIEERKKIVIGNDVFIGVNVTVLDGVTIGDGAIIGAGAVVSKNIPPYAIAVGCPIKIVKYRFTSEDITKLMKIKWWDFDEKELENVEKYFFDVNTFLEKFYSTGTSLEMN